MVDSVAANDNFYASCYDHGWARLKNTSLGVAYALFSWNLSHFYSCTVRQFCKYCHIYAFKGHIELIKDVKSVLNATISEKQGKYIQALC